MQIWVRGIRTRIFAVAITLSFFALAAALVAQVKKGSKDVPVPIYKVDPFWPKPLPNKWILQGIPVMVTDKDDHIWVISRPGDIKPDESGASTNPPRTDCCIAAPAVVEFDTEGNVLQGLGRPGYTPGWPNPTSMPSLWIREGNVWLSSGGTGKQHPKIHWRRQIPLGFRPSRATAGARAKPNRENNQQTDILQGGVFEFTLDEDAQEIYFDRAKACTGVRLRRDLQARLGRKGQAARRRSATIPRRHMTGRQVRLRIRGVRARTSLRPHFGRWPGLRLRTRQRPSSGIHETGQICNQLLRASLDTRSRSRVRRSRQHDVWHVRNRLQPHLLARRRRKYVLIADGTNDKVWIQDRKTGAVRVHWRQRPHGGIFPLDRCDRHRFPRQYVYGRGGYRQADSEVCSH